LPLSPLRAPHRCRFCLLLDCRFRGSTVASVACCRTADSTRITNVSAIYQIFFFRLHLPLIFCLLVLPSFSRFLPTTSCLRSGSVPCSLPVPPAGFLGYLQPSCCIPAPAFLPACLCLAVLRLHLPAPGFCLRVRCLCAWITCCLPAWNAVLLRIAVLPRNAHIHICRSPFLDLGSFPRHRLCAFAGY